MASRTTKVIEGVEHVSAREFSRRLGVMHNAVFAAIKTGRLSKSVRRDGKFVWIEPNLGIREFDLNQLRPHYRDAGKGDARGGEGEGRRELVTAQRLLRIEDAKLKKVKRLKLEGSLIDREAATATAVSVFKIARDRLQAIPSQYADRLIATKDRGELILTLEKAIDEALNSIREHYLSEH